MKPKGKMVEAMAVEVNTILSFIHGFIVHVAGCCGTSVFRACVRRVSNGFALNWGFARINGWRKRSVFLRTSNGKKKKRYPQLAIKTTATKRNERKKKLDVQGTSPL
jgi:hypothetical protein